MNLFPQIQGDRRWEKEGLRAKTLTFQGATAEDGASAVSLDVLAQFGKFGCSAGEQSTFNDNARISKVMPMVDLGCQLNLLEISGFQRVIRPLIGVDEVKFGFCVLQ